MFTIKLSNLYMYVISITLNKLDMIQTTNYVLDSQRSNSYTNYEVYGLHHTC